MPFLAPHDHFIFRSRIVLDREVEVRDGPTRRNIGPKIAGGGARVGKGEIGASAAKFETIQGLHHLVKRRGYKTEIKCEVGLGWSVFTIGEGGVHSKYMRLVWLVVTSVGQ